MYRHIVIFPVRCRSLPLSAFPNYASWSPTAVPCHYFPFTATQVDLPLPFPVTISLSQRHKLISHCRSLSLFPFHSDTSWSPTAFPCHYFPFTATQVDLPLPFPVTTCRSHIIQHPTSTPSTPMSFFVIISAALFTKLFSAREIPCHLFLSLPVQPHPNIAFPCHYLISPNAVRSHIICLALLLKSHPHCCSLWLFFSCLPAQLCLPTVVPSHYLVHCDIVLSPDWLRTGFGRFCQVGRADGRWHMLQNREQVDRWNTENGYSFVHGNCWCSPEG